MKYFKILGILSLLVFSFYMTDLVTQLAINCNPLMQYINNNSENYNIKSVNAIIENNTIIPGIKGKKVNEIESFLNMKDFKEFNKNYLIFDNVLPNINLNDNKDKIIISGNKEIRQVSILIYNNKNILEYSINNNIKYTKLIDNINDINHFEIINVVSSENKFKDIDTILNKNDINKKICIIDYSNIKICREKKYFLVKPNIIYNNNYINTLNDINNGSIILIDNNLNIENFKILINYINSRDLKIVYLSELIKE